MPGNEESAGVKSAGANYSHRCPKGNRQMRRVLNQAANAAVKPKGTIFAIVYRRLVPHLGHAQPIGATAYRLSRQIWKILHQGIRYEERGLAVTKEVKKVRARKLIHELRSLGYSRNDDDFSARYPAVVNGLQKLPNDTVIDGELIVLGDDGRPSLNALHNSGSSKTPILFYVFDVMVLPRRDVEAETLETRRELVVRPDDRFAARFLADLILNSFRLDDRGPRRQPSAAALG
jgi:hypothetical protein